MAWEKSRKVEKKKKAPEMSREIEIVEEETVTNEGIACSRMHRWC